MVDEAAVRAVALATVPRLAPGRGLPEQRHMALLSEVNLQVAPRVWTDDSAMVLAGILAARAYRDVVDDANVFINRFFIRTRLIRPAHLSTQSRANLLASLGDYCCAAGYGRWAVTAATEALLFSDTPELTYRSHSIAALGYAMNGEYEAAIRHLAHAERLFVAQGWPEHESVYPELVARVFVAAARLDADALRQAGVRLSSPARTDPYGLFTAQMADALACLRSGEYARGQATIRHLLYGSERGASHSIVRAFLYDLLSDFEVARGEPRSALAAIEGIETNPGHTVCFHAQRATALIHLGKHREVLRETDPCIETRDEHCLRSLTLVLIRRSLAYQGLGSVRVAMQTMESALLLIDRAGAAFVPFALLPVGDLVPLLERVASEHLDLAPVVSQIVSALQAVGPQARRPSLPAFALTPAEQALADLLLEDESLASIARARSVSLNTIKSQARTLYAKLGVSNRADAVAALVASDAVLHE